MPLAHHHALNCQQSFDNSDIDRLQNPAESHLRVPRHAKRGRRPVWSVGNTKINNDHRGYTKMGKLTDNGDSQAFQTNMMASFVQIAALVILVSYCVVIISPFAGLAIWGVVMAVAIYPLYLKLSAMLGDRRKLAATLIIVIGLAVVLIPGWAMTKSAIVSITSLSADLKAGSIQIPPPSDSVAGWPLIGGRLYALWAGAAGNLEATLNEFQPQLREIGGWLARAIGSAAVGMLQIAASVIIAGVVMLYADSGYALSCSIARKISPTRGEHLTNISIATIRSVTNGVIGVGVIQGVLAGIGFFAMGVPHAGLLAAIVLITAIIQIPALLSIVPIVVWVFSYAAAVPATIFAIYMLFVALSDNVLKPLLLGRGVDLPAIIVLFGALGGMVAYGVIGLFLGAVILGLGYTIISDWLQATNDTAAEEPATDA
jgi:predicted PurR-regulated permease PerM